MRSLATQFNNFWFGPAPASRLAVIRIATGGYALWYLLTRFDMIKRISRSDLSLFEPVGLANIFSEPLPAPVFTLILCIGVLLNIAYITGWRYKWAGPFFAVFLLFILSYRNSWSMVYHSNIALVLHVLVIGFVPAADALSLDFLEKKNTNSKESATNHWRYGWPIKLICAATVFTYFLSGAAKVFGDLAWEWVNGDAMRSQVAVDALRKEVFGETVSPMFEWLYPHTWLFLIMGVGTFILELGAPLAMMNKRAGMIWAFLTFLMHWGIFFIMGIRFRYHMSGLIFLPFFDTEETVPYFKKIFMRRKRENFSKVGHQESPSVVLFDGVCNFCDSTVKFILKNDVQNHFQFASQQSEIGQRLLKEHHAPNDNSTIVLIENSNVYVRSSAILRITRRLQGPWNWLYVLIWMPKPLREGAYALFAKYRYQWFGIKDSCEVPQPHVRAKFLS